MKFIQKLMKIQFLENNVFKTRVKTGFKKTKHLIYLPISKSVVLSMEITNFEKNVS